MAVKSGALEADPVLLEPVMKVEVVTPEEHYGDIIGDLNRRRGVVLGMEDVPSGEIRSSRSANVRNVRLRDRYEICDARSSHLLNGV